MAEFLRPSSVEDVLAARSKHPDYQLLAGGTDYMVASKFRAGPVGVIDLFGVPELVGIDEEDGGLRIGAATTYAQLLASERIASDLPVLHAACREVGAAQIQSRGTIGGNIATSSPVGDTLPPLLALEADIEVASAGQSRRIPYRDFATGYREIDLASNEIIVAIHIPAQPQDSLQFWRKIGTRRAQSISKVMVAAVGRVTGDRIEHACIGIGAVADRSIRVYETEKAILGQPANSDTAERARQALRAEILPIDDLRSRAAYRLQVAENVVARFVLRLGAAHAS